MIGASMAARAPRTRGLGQMAMDAIRRNGGTLLLPGAATPVLGEELVANGDFSNGTTGWGTPSTAPSSAAAVGGVARVTAAPGSSLARLRTSLTVPAGVYLVSFTNVAVTGVNALALAVGNLTSGDTTYGNIPGTSVGTFSAIFTVAAGTLGLAFTSGSVAGAVTDVDNISVREVTGYTHGNPPLRNYLDSAGTDLLDSVTQVDQPVGLCLDSMGVLGAELAGLSTAWLSYGTGISLSGGQMTFTATPAGQFSLRGTPLTSGKTYEVEFTVASISGGGISMLLGGGAATAIATTPGTYRAVLKATAADGPYLWANTATTTAVIASASCREILGNHASQATTANKGILRRTGNRYRWEFDGTDTLNMTLPAGFNAATTIDARSTGHVTLQSQNIVGAYSIGPSITSFGRIILPSSPSASDLALLQRYANWLAEVSA